MTIQKRLMHAYQQAPWRLRTQKGVLFLILAILGASVLWIMLTVTVQAASAGLEAQTLQYQQESMQRTMADLRTEYAVLTSASRMEERALKLGFKQPGPESINYIIVKGYQGRQTQISAPPPTALLKPLLIKPVYTQSLSEWLLQGILKINEKPGGIIP